MPAAIAYARTGSGPPLVLVHGITESRHSWDPLIPSLAERFDVVAVDLRGHGESAKVNGIWELVIDGPVAELDAFTDAVLDGVTVPYLSLHGIDPGPPYVEWLTARCPTATVEVWPDQSHYPHLADPERFLARVAEFTGHSRTSATPD